MVLLHLVALLIWGAAAPEAELPRGNPAAPFLAVHDSVGVAVIVHQGPGVEEMEAAQVRRVFLLRQRFWTDGSAVVPVNLPASSPIREEFSERVLGQTTRELAGYWSDLYFHGTQPPRVLDSEEAVLLFVTRTPGSIGYVSLPFLRSRSIPPGVQVVGVWGGEGRLDGGRLDRVGLQRRSSCSAPPSPSSRSCRP